MAGWKLKREYKPKFILRSSLPILAVLAVVGSLAGYILDSFETVLENVPILFLMVPPVIGLGGSLGGIIDSHLGTALDLDAVELKLSDPVLKANIIGGSLASITVFTALGIAVHFLALALELPSPGLPTVVAIAGVTGIVLTVITVPLAVASAFISDELGESAEDFALPIVTTIIDLLGIIILFVVANQLLSI